MKHSQYLQIPWDEYALLQERANCHKLNHKAWAIEEQLNEFLNSSSVGCLPRESEIRSKWLDNLATNRAKKHRNRRRLLRVWFPPHHIPSQSLIVIDTLILNEEVARIGVRTTPQEWRILWNLALGEDYKTVARAENMTATALKSKVSRCRRRLRFATGA